MVVVFLLKKTYILKNGLFNHEVNPKNGLAIFNNTTLEDLVNKDTDSDGIPDWQEGLYGLDPTKKETTPGTPDSSALNKIRVEEGNSTTTQGGGNASALSTENLTQTEKFSRELFATVAALNQNGQMDQATIDALSNSLAEKVENPVQRTVYTISDIKIINSDTKQTIQKYSNELDKVYINKQTTKSVPAVLQEFIADETNVDKLSELDPVINKTNKIISELLKIQVPQSISLLHLDLINNYEKIVENISDIKLFETDPVMVIGAIIQYGNNVTSFTTSAKNLTDTIKQKLSN